MRKIIINLLIVGMIGLVTFHNPADAQAGALTALSDVVTRHKVSEFSNHTIRYTTTSGVAVAESMSVTFPAGFNLGSLSFSDVDVSWGPSTGAETDLTIAATPSGTTWGVNVSGQIVTITSGIGTINANSKVIIKIGNHTTIGGAGSIQIQNPGSATTALVSIGGSFPDSGKIAIAILNDDQIPVTATIDPYLTFSLSSLSTSFGSLSASSVTTSTPNITLSISTNAPHGYSITVRDTGDTINSGLFNATIGYLIGSANSSFANSAALVGGTEGYGIQASSATATVAAPYNSGGNTVGALEQNLTPLASYPSLPANTQTVVVTHKAAVAITSAAGQYADSITYGISGNF